MVLFKALRAVRRARSPILMFKLRVPTEFTFRGTFNVFFCTSGTIFVILIIFSIVGIIFEGFFTHWEHFGAVVGSLFESKISLELQRCPKSRHPRNKVTLLESFWSYVFEILRFFDKKSNCERSCVFSSIYWSPWALQVMGSYAIRTRRRSPNTLLHFHTSSKNSSQQTSFWAHFRSDFRHKSQFWLKKGFQTNVHRKGAPPYANKSLWPWPGAPWQPPSRARFSEQETAVWARNKSSCSFLSPFLSPCPGMGYFWVNFWKLFIFWWNLKHSPSQKGWWSNTPWAKAQRISSDYS